MNTKAFGLAFLIIVAAWSSHVIQAGVGEDGNLRPPLATNAFRILNTKTSPKEVTVETKTSTVGLKVEGQATNVSVELAASRFEYAKTGGEQLTSLAAYELQIKSKDNASFVWSCWTPAFPIPHRFKVLTTESGTSYACYIRSGVHLFRLSESRMSDAMSHRFWQSFGADQDHPDALPGLQLAILKQTLGNTNLYGIGPQKFDLVVDRLSDDKGELQITVHGAVPQPRCVFALRNGKWELLSTTGK